MKITDICKLSDEVKSGELLECVFLDQVFNAPDSKEADRDFVLRATYPTEQLRSLLEHICQKLSGTHSKGIAVVRGDYGSGKSHTMLALYHLVTAGEEAKETLNQWGIKAKIPDNSRVAAAQLRSEDPDTLWELIFERTGEKDLFEQIGDYPKREEWASLGHKQPTLIILDELEEWFEGQDEVMKTHTKNALSNLIEASQLPDVPLAVTVTVYGTNDELMTRINRLQPPVYDVGTASEREKIIRHRLVDELDELKAKQVVKSYIDNYQKISGDLPSLVNLADLRKEMEESYPFHPHFLRQAHQVYSGMSRSESTRGIVAVCATLLRQKAKKRDLILTGDLDITDEDIASDLRKLDPELVQNATEDLRQRFSDISQAANIVGTVLLHSFSPHGTPGASSEDIIIGSMTADVNINELRATWEKVENQGWFIDRTGERLVVTKEVVLAKQIDQMARSRLNTPEGKAEASDYLLSLLSEKIPSDSIFYEQESEQLAVSSSGRGIKYILSLLPLRADSARDILTDLNNTVLLIAPKVHVLDILS